MLVAASENEAHQLRVEVAAKILHPRGVRLGLRAGELLTISTSDAEHESWLLDAIPRTIAALTATVAAAIALLIISIPLGLAVLVGTPLILWLLQRTAPLITRRATVQQALAARASAMATDLVSGLRPLRGVGGEAVAATRYRVVSQVSLRMTMRTARTSSLYAGISATVSALLAVAIGGFAGFIALDGRLSIGGLITVVGLSYGSLCGLNLSVRPGELLGVLAYRPQDAEALVSVLSGQLAPEDYEGTVRLGDIALPLVDLAEARRSLLVEPHQTDLFAGTVRSNVTAANPDAPWPLVVRRALVASAADTVVEDHPDGLDHQMTDRGASLSGGQRQRVALARALVAQSPVLVLHDPTTAVDAVTEQAIAEGIAALRHAQALSEPAAHTTILITSSPALLSATHRVVILADGRVRNEGTHDDLAATDDDYRRMVLVSALGAAAALVPVYVFGILVDRVRDGAPVSAIIGIAVVVTIAALLGGVFTGCPPC